MHRFSSPFGSDPDEPWFRVGTVAVTSSVLVAALCCVSMLVYAIDRSLLIWLAPISDGSGLVDASAQGVRQGQVWRILTWPMVNAPEFWTLLSIAIIWYFGSEFEHRLGRRRFLWFLGIVVVVPACVYVLAVPTLLEQRFVLGEGGLLLPAISGARFLASAVIIAFVVAVPSARSFFNVPFWVIVVAFEAIEVLHLLGERAWDVLFFWLVLAVVAMVTSRSFGLSGLEWIPKLPLPAFLSGPGGNRASAQRRRRARRRRLTGTPPLRPVESTPTPNERLRQAEVDVLLDKISQHGIKSLTREERRRLDEHSRRMRNDG